MKAHSIMKQTSNRNTIDTTRGVLLSWVTIASATTVVITIVLILSFIRPEIDYAFDSPSGTVKDCFGVDEVISGHIGMDFTVKHPHSTNESKTKTFSVSCTWTWEEKDRPTEYLSLHFTVGNAASNVPDKKDLIEEKEYGSTIITDNLNGFGFGFCYVEPEIDPTLPPGAIEMHTAVPTRSCKARDSNFRLSFSTNKQSIDLPKITEASGLVLQKAFRR